MSPKLITCIRSLADDGDDGAKGWCWVVAVKAALPVVLSLAVLIDISSSASN